MLVHRRVPNPSAPLPTLKFAVTHLYAWVEREPVRVKCLAQEYNAMTRAQTRSTRSEDERTNHEATNYFIYMSGFMKMVLKTESGVF